MNKFGYLQGVIASLMASVFKTTMPIQETSGSGGWPGFVQPSAMRIAHKRAAHVNPRYKRHQGAKECAKRRHD